MVIVYYRGLQVRVMEPLGFNEETIQIWPALWSAGGTRPAGISLSPGSKDVRCSAMSLQKCLKLGCHASTQLLADVERESAVSLLTGHEDGMLAVASSSDRKRLVPGSDGDTVNIWNTI